MPLSENEQRLLDQIEQAFYAEDPKFANAYRTTDLRTLQRRQLVRAGILVLAGIGMAAAGVVLAIVPLIAGGGVVALAGIGLAVTAWRRLRPPHEARPQRVTVREHDSWRARLEARWERRWEDRGR